jgi:hypothetical protein
VDVWRGFWPHLPTLLKAERILFVCFSHVHVGDKHFTENRPHGSFRMASKNQARVLLCLLAYSAADYIRHHQCRSNAFIKAVVAHRIAIAHVIATSHLLCSLSSRNHVKLMELHG